MKIKISLTILCFSFLWIGQLPAQELLPKKIKMHTIGWHPLPLIDGGLSFDFEQRLDNPKNWMKIRLTGFYLPYRNYDYHDDYYDYSSWSTFNSGFETFNSLKGAGLGLNYKSFFRKDVLYWSGGLEYNYYNVGYEGGEYVPFKENGMTYYEYVEGNIKQTFNKVGANINIGVQTPLRKPIFIDGFLTLGYTYSFYDKNKAAFNDGMMSFGYRGVFFGIGGRVGFSW